MKIAYISNSFDSTNLSNPNGIGYYITTGLRNAGAEIINIPPPKSFIEYIFKIKQLLYKFILKKKYIRHREPLLLKSLARKREKLLLQTDADCVFMFGSVSLSELNTNIPVFFLTDALFDDLKDIYTDFSNLCADTIVHCKRIETQALNKAELVFMSSQWAKDSAVKTYNIIPNKVVVTGLGANLKTYPDKAVILRNIESRSNETIKILFIGMDWERKNGDLVFQAVKLLRDKGISAQLEIIGCTPELEASASEFVKIRGLLDKSNPNDLKIFQDALASSHLFVMPSKAETYGHVYCEASAFGIPVIAADVMGVSNAVNNGINGFLIPDDSNAELIADRIIKATDNRQSYIDLCKSSFEEFHNRNNWEINCKTMYNHIQDSLNRNI